jgi:hypothetical protein
MGRLVRWWAGGGVARRGGGVAWSRRWRWRRVVMVWRGVVVAWSWRGFSAWSGLSWSERTEFWARGTPKSGGAAEMDKPRRDRAAGMREGSGSGSVAQGQWRDCSGAVGALRAAWRSGSA